jgi:hypothetical protein
MNPLLHAANVGAAIALVTFFAAFVLTLWPSRVRTAVAAILYAIGTWVSLGILARNYFVVVRINYGLSDSGSANTAALFWLLLPIMAVVYALAAPALLWPAIPQPKAMRYGKALHLVFVPLLALTMFVAIYTSAHGYLSDQLKWLVYGLMWFRIREGYAKSP